MQPALIGVPVFLAVFSLFVALASRGRVNPLLEAFARGRVASDGGRRESFFVRLWNLRGESSLGLEGAVLAGAAAGTAVFFLVAALLDPLFAAPLAVGGFLLGPRALNAFLYRQRIKAFRNTVEFGLDTLLTALHIGLPMERALREASAHSPEPIRTEFLRVAEEISKGVPEPEAFRNMAARVPCVEAEELCEAVELYVKVGGPRALELLRQVLTNLRDGVSMRYQVHQHTRGAKTSAVMVTLIPVGYMAFMLAFAPDLFGPLLTTQAGRVSLFVAVLVFFAGLGLVLNILRSIEEF
ncbi:type II secretion system F family protein [Desulfovirgula thermocuniculi]|uniref:type II secretion system F family protein n=1 Tax=Desulfovirgula thermocuniculi TaxID=348842 RepID=UPI0012ECB484|nr:type II secretion system F family protein [Desulfovirgula thermocuniculi]